MGEIQRLHEMQSTLRGGRIDIDVLHTLGPCRGTVHKIAIEHGTRSTPVTSLLPYVPRAQIVQETLKNPFTSMEKAGHTRQLPPSLSTRRRYVNSKGVK